MNSTAGSSNSTPNSKRLTLLDQAALKAEALARRRANSLGRYTPYEKQKSFHAAGAKARERLFMAGNQLGKTLAGGMEAAIHATGRYPEWWQGRRFDRPTIGWAAGVSGEGTRDNVQRMLLGRSCAFGTGALPKEAVEKTTSARGASELVDTIHVAHMSGGTSQISLKSYEKGRAKWQGETLDWVWFDEEPPLDVYTEGLTRTNATGGCVWMTFTPLLGMSDVVARFLTEESPGRSVTRMTIDDAAHLTESARQIILASYPEHEREARARGVPALGSGRVFPIAEEKLREDAFDIPDHWPRICGLDIGWDHPTAAVWLAWDRDADVVHVTDCYRVREETPVVHAASIKARGDWVPVAWPQDALQHDKGSGQQIAELYRDQGVNMLPDPATFQNGGNSVEAGVLDMLDRMKTARFKVAAHLEEWWEEFRLYHRKDGKLVKERDDLLSATRYGMMMLRWGVTHPVSRPEFSLHSQWVV